MALPGLTVLVFVGLLAAWAFISGTLELRAAYNLEKDHGRWWMALGGIISIVFGIVLVAAPRFGAVVVSWWVGAYATFFGASLLALAFQLRLRNTGPGSPATASRISHTPRSKGGRCARSTRASRSGFMIQQCATDKRLFEVVLPHT